MKLRGTMFNFKWLVAIMAALFIVIGIGQTAIALDAEDYPLGDVPLDQATYQKFLKPMSEGLTDAAPFSYDARDDNIVTPAKDQGGCGSCWAFASVGAMESHILKQAGPNYDLSEQQQNRCNLAMGGCMGGSSSAPQYWETNGPITEACYPYTATDGACDHMCTEMDYRVTGWHTVTQTPLGFKDSCYDDGPSYWRYDVYGDFYDYWNGGSPGDVYTQTTGSRLGGHAVLIIGWDDAKGAYLCKNSWGQNAGPNGDGTFWIAYTGHANDLGFAMSNFNITGGSQWRYCFNDTNYSDVGIELVNDGKQLRGQATLPGDASFPAPITGYIIGDYALIAINYLGDSGFRFYKINLNSMTGQTWGVEDTGEYYDTPHSAEWVRCDSESSDNSGSDSGTSDGLVSGDAADTVKNLCMYASDWPSDTLSIILETGILRGQRTAIGSDPAPITGALVGKTGVFGIGYTNDNIRMYQVAKAGLAGTGWAIVASDSTYYHSPHPITLSRCPTTPFELGDHVKGDASVE